VVEQYSRHSHAEIAKVLAYCCPSECSIFTAEDMYRKLCGSYNYNNNNNNNMKGKKSGWILYLQPLVREQIQTDTPR